jgi:putative Ca2+/H+ antiporter (TMEM165/GDT1 family)
VDREITTHVNVFAGVVLGTALTENDVACFGNLTAEELYAKALTVTVAAVIGTTYTFLVCHDNLF